jgi:hypothetical protein
MHDVNILLSDCSRGGRTGMGCPGKTVESEAAPGPKRRRRLRGEMTPWRDSLRGSVGAVRDNIHYPQVDRMEPRRASSGVPALIAHSVCRRTEKQPCQQPSRAMVGEHAATSPLIEASSAR